MPAFWPIILHDELALNFNFCLVQRLLNTVEYELICMRKIKLLFNSNSTVHTPTPNSTQNQLPHTQLKLNWTSAFTAFDYCSTVEQNLISMRKIKLNFNWTSTELALKFTGWKTYLFFIYLFILFIYLLIFGG